jgi:hypothetical protein
MMTYDIILTAACRTVPMNVRELYESFARACAVMEASPKAHDAVYERMVERVLDLAEKVLTAPANGLDEIRLKLQVAMWRFEDAPKAFAASILEDLQRLDLIGRG